jgi:hypothetical protein
MLFRQALNRRRAASLVRKSRDNNGLVRRGPFASDGSVV